MCYINFKHRHYTKLNYYFSYFHSFFSPTDLISQSVNYLMSRITTSYVLRLLNLKFLFRNLKTPRNKFMRSRDDTNNKELVTNRNISRLPNNLLIMFIMAFACIIPVSKMYFQSIFKSV